MRIPKHVWQADRDTYLARVRPWAEERLRRMARHEKHPVYDFLFEYYSFRPAHLLRWTPGFDVILEGAERGDVAWSEFREADGGLSLVASEFAHHRIPYLEWAVKYLEAVQAREPSFICMGVHEWAMVYRESEVRHSRVPLRLSRPDTDALVESLPVRCTHYDAFRFFTPAAVPLNRWRLTRATTIDHDQPGCLHVNMDLYRFAYKIAPFCPSSLVADTFELARMARVTDMRASPYDLTAFGCPPLKIESREGREEYVEHQRMISANAQLLRAQLLKIYRELHFQCSQLLRLPESGFTLSQNHPFPPVPRSG